ncbi:MAG: NAD(P)H-hydrate epimerase, partial [bacterium]
MSIFGSSSPTEFSKPAGIAVSHDGSRVAVADTLNYRVRVFSVNPVSGVLTPLFNFGSHGTSEATFQAPLGVAFSPEGDIYVADSLAVGIGNNRLQVFSSSGGFLRTFGEYGTNVFQFVRLLGVGVGRDGKVYTADGQANRVQTFGSDDGFGWFYGSSGSSTGKFNWVWDAQPGMGGLLYLADLNNNRIQIVNTSPARTVAGVVTNTGLPLATLNLPRGVAPAPDSDALYVADTYNNRVLRLRVLVDSDGDGMDDVWEIMHGLNPLDPSDAALDPDGDGVTNIGEYRLGTDPHNLDTNGNGLYDGAELMAGSDPTALGGPMTLRITGIGRVPPVLTWLGDETNSPPDALLSLARARAAGVEFAADAPGDLDPGDLCIDALLGIGSSGALRGRLAALAQQLNDSAAPVLAVDLPSGLNADTGAWLGTAGAQAEAAAPSAAVRAQHTLSLLTLKPGLFTAHGRDASGRVWLDDLALDTAAAPCSATLLGEPTARSRLHASHKGSFGDVAIVGGAKGMSGAALLAARAALHGGAGRVYVALLDPDAIRADSSQPELMFRDFDALDAQGMTLVCGCGGGEAVRAVLPRVLGHREGAKSVRQLV